MTDPIADQDLRSELQRIRDALTDLHAPEWHTDYNAPCLDEFDSPTRRYRRCRECKARLYRDNDTCPTIAALRPVREQEQP